MAQIVNNILNYLKLDTRDYDSNGKKIAKNTAKNTKQMSKSFKDLASDVKKHTSAMTVALGTFAGNIATKAFSSITSGIVETTRSFENATTSLSAWTGSMESAKDLFWQLNALEDETTIATDKLAQSFIALKKYGLDSSNDSLKAYSSIAVGLGKDLNTVTEAIGRASQGQLKGLKDLGIVAKQEGDKISLTYQGITKTINANTADLQAYMREFASDNFSNVLENRTKTIGGALDRFKNAFGTLQTVLFNTDTATGQVFINIVNKATDCVNGLIKVFSSPEFNKQMFEVVDNLSDYWNSFFSDTDKNAKTTTDDFGFYWETSIGYVRNILMSLVAEFTTFFNYVKGGFNGVSEGIAQTLYDLGNKDTSFIGLITNLGKNIGSGLKTELEDVKKENEQIENAVLQSFNDYANTNRELIKRKELEKTVTKEKEKQLALVSNPIFSGRGSSSSGATSNAVQEYEKLKEIARKAIYDITATDEQKQRDSITNKIAELQNYYNQALISEQEFQEAKSKLIDDYYKKQAKKDVKHIGSDNYIEYMTNGLNDLSNAFGNLTANMNENSNSYKALFAIEKGFAVASATANSIVAWTKALATATNWYEGLANYANAVALTTNIISQLSSITMHDKGGTIASGKLGIVGEYGPEIVRGPANVTSRKDTAELLENAGSNVVVNLYEDNSKAGTVEQNQTDEGSIINIFVSNIRKGGQMASVLQQSYGLKRVGY